MHFIGRILYLTLLHPIPDFTRASETALRTTLSRNSQMEPMRGTKGTFTLYLKVTEHGSANIRLRGGGPSNNLMNYLSPELVNATRLSEKQFFRVARAVWQERSTQNGTSLENEKMQSFRAGRMVTEGKTLRPMAEKGLLVFERSEDDDMIHLLWMDRNTNADERQATVDLILVPGKQDMHI